MEVTTDLITNYITSEELSPGKDGKSLQVIFTQSRTTQTENLRNRIIDKHLFSSTLPDGTIVFDNAINTKKYYDQMIAAGDTPEDIIETISIHLTEGQFKLTQLTKSIK